MEKFIVVDDEPIFREILSNALKRREFEVFSAGDFDGALALITKYKPEKAVFDLRLPGKSGLELITAALKIQPELKIVVLTGYGSIATALEAVRLGALCYLAKPADVDEIINAFSNKAFYYQEDEETGFEPPSLARAEWEHIQRVLNDCGGNISLAAKKLGIHRRTLQRKLFKFAP